ncbi:MAG: hypothetical protein AABX40_00510 [Candidatus Hydrothermarchaeota archaeon]
MRSFCSKYVALLFLLLSALFATITGGCVSAPQEVKNLTFETVLGSEGSQVYFDTSRPPIGPAVITNKTEWEYFGPYSKPPNTPLPIIDFKDEFIIGYTVLVVGYARFVTILNVTQSAGVINITLATYRWPGVQTTPEQIDRYPHHFVRIKKSELLQKGNLTFMFTDISGEPLGNVTRFIP